MNDDCAYTLVGSIEKAVAKLERLVESASQIEHKLTHSLPGYDYKQPYVLYLGHQVYVGLLRCQPGVWLVFDQCYCARLYNKSTAHLLTGKQPAHWKKRGLVYIPVQPGMVLEPWSKKYPPTKPLDSLELLADGF